MRNVVPSLGPASLGNVASVGGNDLWSDDQPDAGSFFLLVTKGSRHRCQVGYSVTCISGVDRIFVDKVGGLEENIATDLSFHSTEVRSL